MFQPSLVSSSCHVSVITHLLPTMALSLRLIVIADEVEETVLVQNGDAVLDRLRANFLICVQRLYRFVVTLLIQGRRTFRQRENDGLFAENQEVSIDRHLVHRAAAP